MVRKRVDERVRRFIEEGVALEQRSLVVLVGDYGKDQVVNLHAILSKARVRARPSVLWCYKKELGFSTHRKKRMKAIKKQIARGLHDATDEPFELFISQPDIRWCYYRDTHKILGATYGTLVLQDFEALTPNLLARTIETVEGGGLVVVLLRTVTSLKQLYAMSMDVHARFRTGTVQYLTDADVQYLPYLVRVLVGLNKKCAIMVHLVCPISVQVLSHLFSLILYSRH